MSTENFIDSEYNPVSLDALCAALAYALGVEAPACAAAPEASLISYVDAAFGGERADRVFMYNPDAIAQWLSEKYARLLSDVTARTDLSVPFRTVMPSVTPVCFGTMYTGAQPAVHGIRRYEKPVIRIDTLFDALIRAGRKPCIIAEAGCSMAHIFNERDMDYFIYPTIAEVNAKAAAVIMEDKYDFIAVYNGNYDSVMHKTGPESVDALAELRLNAHTFAVFSDLIRARWTSHNTLLGFAMDHGCHEIDGASGSHGLDMPEDLNIVHRYMAIKRG